ncbi:MAG: hypothetical protein ACO2ZP_00590 [Bacteriovoracaceae bacterium]
MEQEMTDVGATTNNDASTMQENSSVETHPGARQETNENFPTGYDTHGQEINYEPWEVPEGVSISEELGNQFEGLARQLGLNQEQAQAIVDLGVQQANSFENFVDQSWTETRNNWVEEITRDPVFGGSNLKQTIAHANHAISRFGGPEFKEFLTSTGLGDNGQIIKFLAKVNHAFAEDRVVNSTASASRELPIAKKLYPNMR